MADEEGLNREEWQAKLELLGEALLELGRPLRLELIGAWPLIDAGMPARSTFDLDVWAPTSQIDRTALRKACAAAEIDFDPMGEVFRPYLQIVQPGIVNFPEHVPRDVGQWGSLTICIPPPAALAAAKLTRAQPKDLSDIQFMRGRYRLSRDDVAYYVARIPDRAQRETATENLVYFDLREEG